MPLRAGPCLRRISPEIHRVVKEFIESRGISTAHYGGESPASYAQRLATARLLHRFSFGPKPGQYTEMLQRGIAETQSLVFE